MRVLSILSNQNLRIEKNNINVTDYRYENHV